MNKNNVDTQIYAQKVELLLRLMPIVMEEGVFAVHGGTAINLFLKNLPRYSVDIDLTYTPLAGRQEPKPGRHQPALEIHQREG